LQGLILALFNPQAPSKKLMLEWVKKAWDSISSELLVKSFKVCVLTTAVDGSEDDQIHCLKKNQPCFPAFEMLKIARTTETIETLNISDDADETEHNEILIQESNVEDEENEIPLSESSSESGSDSEIEFH
jgi:hypothetical protein